MFELGDGELEGVRVLSEKNVKERRTPGVKVDETAQYGLGLFYDDVKGLETWGHGGNTLGFTSDLVFLPQHKLGWVLLTNAGASPLRNIFQQYVLEVLFAAEPQARKRLSHTLNRLSETNSKLRQQVTRSVYRMKWVEPLVGRWHSEELGAATISRDKRGFSADFGEWKTELGVLTDKHSTNTLVSVSPPFAGGIALQLQPDGTLLLDAGQTKYTFKKVAP